MYNDDDAIIGFFLTEGPLLKRELLWLPRLFFP